MNLIKFNKNDYPFIKYYALAHCIQYSIPAGSLLIILSILFPILKATHVLKGNLLQQLTPFLVILFAGLAALATLICAMALYPKRIPSSMRIRTACRKNMRQANQTVADYTETKNYDFSKQLMLGFLVTTIFSSCIMTLLSALSLHTHIASFYMNPYLIGVAACSVLGIIIMIIFNHFLKKSFDGSVLSKMGRLISLIFLGLFTLGGCIFGSGYFLQQSAMMLPMPLAIALLSLVIVITVGFFAGYCAFMCYSPLDYKTQTDPNISSNDSNESNARWTPFLHWTGIFNHDKGNLAIKFDGRYLGDFITDVKTAQISRTRQDLSMVMAEPAIFKAKQHTDSTADPVIFAPDRTYSNEACFYAELAPPPSLPLPPVVPAPGSAPMPYW